jgi:hypothetical protein
MGQNRSEARFLHVCVVSVEPFKTTNNGTTPTQDVDDIDDDEKRPLTSLFKDESSKDALKPLGDCHYLFASR